MILTFTKELPKRYYLEGHGYLTKCKLYRVFKDGNELGRFFYHYNICFFSFENQSYHIDFERHFFKRSKFYLIDENSQRKIGEFKLSSLLIDLGWLILDNQNIYVGNKKTPVVRFSLFDAKTWGHRRIQISNKVNAVVYDFRIKTPIFRTRDIQLYPFSGQLELWGENLLLAFAGFFLLENVLSLEDA